MAVAIQAQHLVKTYGSVQAVRDVSLQVESGEIFGLLGHNGAGKTTTIRMLTGRTKPTSGRAEIVGFDVVDSISQVRPRINLVFEDANLYERLSGQENLALFAHLYEVPTSRVRELLALVDLTDAASRKVKKYSTGMKQRLLIARALINSPQVLFLDEPTRGLDPASARDLRNLIRQFAAEGMTIFLTTHYMNEADELCHRVAFLKEGEVVAMDSPQELKLRFGKPTARVLLEDRSEIEISLDSAEDAARLDQWMRDGLVRTIHSQEGTLEDVFINIAGAAT
ncbi:MAG TPA: ABC transporter ATP-binding protein [Thermomicrobiales bacterium]|nr:ABC transporter ATP-binding protein [Thermomicrobiales bacterium]HRA47330.1 ABC transporter ATP-binding protein [Thermomicrobiales bacterium]